MTPPEPELSAEFDPNEEEPNPKPVAAFDPKEVEPNPKPVAAFDPKEVEPNPKPTAEFDPKEERTTVDVQQMMKPIYQEHDEPRDGFEAVPVWMAAIFGGLIFWGGWYFATNSGAYRGDVYDTTTPVATVPAFEPETPEQLYEVGRQLYAEQCAVCHKAGGGGQPPAYPPLMKADWVVGKEAKPERLIRIVLYGVKGDMTVNGEKYSIPMSGYGGRWNDRQVAAVLTYIRQSWGNAETTIMPEAVAEIRKAEATRPYNDTGLMTVAEILAK